MDVYDILVYGMTREVLNKNTLGYDFGEDPDRQINYLKTNMRRYWEANIDNSCPQCSGLAPTMHVVDY